MKNIRHVQFFGQKPTDFLFGRRLWTAVGSYLVGRIQKRYNRPVEVGFLCLTYTILVGSTTICLNYVV